MPARMWKHGIHSFLEVLRRRLPESLDYMLAFIYLAYQMMALLYETAPTLRILGSNILVILVDIAWQTHAAAKPGQVLHVSGTVKLLIGAPPWAVYTTT
jgi:hypothetical protein